MHHGSDPFDGMTEDERKAFEEARQQLMQKQLELLGATGRFPDGKLIPGDEGELAFEVITYHGQVLVNFNKPVAWFSMLPQQARDLALALRQHANEIERNLGA